MPTHRDRIILFTRYPEPGHCKTRLIPAVGADGAAALQKWMTEQTVSSIKAVTANDSPTLEIHFDGGDEHLMQHWLGQNLRYRPQSAGDIGQRMTRSFCPQFQDATRVLLLGSDCPQISPAILTEALNSLDNHDLVLGPTHDGGYYLIGTTNRLPYVTCSQLFSNINWSTKTVFTETMNRVSQLHLNCHRLPKLYDIDTADDLHHIDYRPDSQ
ncbi:glycosyltransferase [Methanococcoides sp. SA1]|uniref:TIGR04282 family arsenosugar biosynthesis glycosyltransferase n=1 Tax=Candidatus Desulfatifera sulfidica TaxID=2841691 RepID=A0A8J6N6I1_9BACT|nr:TIGR04282 family arsenosugar biosynthesis glycosyltransferase [Candidatus Desulfatifera sulfidica]NPE29459.1 glycosyltransferase [Methanococcoides sp. SA1]